jgi:TonB family protein
LLETLNKIFPFSLYSGMVLHLSIAFLFLSGLFRSDDLPEFKGGERELNGFISRSLIYPEYSKLNCIQGTVQVSFQLTRKGKIFNSRVQRGYGIDIDVEALRIVRLTSGLWKVPASFDTTQAMVLPIKFELKEYNCDERSPDQIRDAIAAYKAREDLTKAVINFYAKKASGTYSAEDEKEVLDLKDQLGYNDRFFERLLRQAKQKLRQGDNEGACEDFSLIHQLGSDKSKSYLSSNCR